MKVCLAGLSADSKHLPTLKPPYVLESFIYMNEKTLEYIKSPNCKHFMLDSGAFTFLNKSSENIDWNDYVDKYCNFKYCFTNNGKWSTGGQLININIQPIYTLNINYYSNLLEKKLSIFNNVYQ